MTAADELLVLPRSRLFIGLAQQRGGMNGGDRMHTSKILRFSMDLPIATEIVESEQKIQAFLPISDEMIEDDLTTMEKVQALHYRGIKKE